MLKTLRLSENRLTGVPEEIGRQSAFIFFLMCGQNKVKILSGNLEKLENLFLSVNLISALPNSMERLKNLKVLDVSQNLLQSLPAFLIRLKKLDTVNLSKNKVTSLPPDLSALSTTELSLNQNQVTVVPESLARAPRLRTLRLEENCLNLEGIPKELLADSKVRRRRTIAKSSKNPMLCRFRRWPWQGTSSTRKSSWTWRDTTSTWRGTPPSKGNWTEKAPSQMLFCTTSDTCLS